MQRRPLFMTTGTDDLGPGSSAADVQGSVDTVARWIKTLRSFYHGFLFKPWFKRISVIPHVRICGVLGGRPPPATRW